MMSPWKVAYFADQKIAQILQNSRDSSAAKYNPTKIVKIGCRENLLSWGVLATAEGLYDMAWQRKNITQFIFVPPALNNKWVVKGTKDKTWMLVHSSRVNDVLLKIV